jgi:catechol 2,3-dioxygenase-like lactoylglutathione lyase family enzyme
MIFDHVGIPASDLKRSKDFFCKALAPLGIGIVMEVSDAVGLGKDKKPSLWLGEHKDRPLPLHIAFVAESRAQVRSFYQAALAAGASDNGPPGVREHYHPSYYAAFVIGPDGHNIEAVCHRPT